MFFAETNILHNLENEGTVHSTYTLINGYLVAMHWALKSTWRDQNLKL